MYDELNFTIVIAKTKSQAIMLYEKIKIDSSEINNFVKFVVDRDYDLSEINDNMFLTLDSYSVESYLVDSKALKSYLCDECRVTIQKIDILNDIINTFNHDFTYFCEIAKIVCKPLFILHNHEGRCEFYPTIKELININYGSISYTDNYRNKIPNLENLDEEALSHLSHLFDNYSERKAIRGKYLYEFFNNWLNSLRNHLDNRRKENSQYRGILINWEAFKIPMRRFASVVDVPAELRSFLVEVNGDIITH